MNNALHHNVASPTKSFWRETLSASTEIEAEVLFVDLDYTLLEGAVVDMTDEELEGASLIYETLAFIFQAKGLGIQVVMVTRNNDMLIERFFAAKPECTALFDESIPCETGKKSDPILTYLNSKQIDPKKAIFVDDTPGELDDVKREMEGTHTLHPNNIGQTKLKKPELEKTEYLQQSSRKKLISLLKKMPYADERQKIKKALESIFLINADKIDLAA